LHFPLEKAASFWKDSAVKRVNGMAALAVDVV
jgi:hypothetical protein